MSKKTIIALVLSFALILLMVASVAITAYTTDEQKPEIRKSTIMDPSKAADMRSWAGAVSKAVVWDNGMQYDNGWAAQDDPASGLDPIPADDFMFDVDQLVNDVHWIGAYVGPPDDGDFDWRIIFYNDIGDGTKPGAAIATWVFPNANVNETFIEEFMPGVFMYSYAVDLPAPLSFLAGTKYWISIQGVGAYPPQSYWAMHSDPILLHEAVFKSVFYGYPNWTDATVVQGKPYDMCYQLTYEEEWPNHKMHFPQLPDLIGWDVLATYPKILADDWQCSRTGPVTDIHFWGSWKDQDGIPETDDTGQILYFIFSIHDNIPPDVDTPWSRPGELLWRMEEWLDGTPHDPPTLEGWFDPNTGEVFPNDHVPYWRYDFVDIPDPFTQYKDSIYWLNISAVLADPINYQWGWKNSRDHFMDDAVYRDDQVPMPWMPLFEPPRQNYFNVYFGPDSIPEDQGSTNYYGSGWYRYEYWWNMWFYNNPFNYNPKHIWLEFFVDAIYPHSWAEFAINWSTAEWSAEGEPGRPPLPGEDETRYIGRQIFPVVPGPNTIDFWIDDYNPEWVSIDFVAQDVIISGWIWHECVPTSMDMAFVITGPECTPSIDAKKQVWDETLGEYVDSTDIDSCSNANFLITIHNDGTCCDLTDIVVTDFMDASLEYLTADPPPDYVDPTPTGTLIGWSFPGPLEPCNTIDISVVAHVIGPPCHLDSNSVDVNAFCEASGVDVNDYDVAYVHATQPDLDFGDAPDPTYPTLLATGGARHVIVPGVFLGAFIDPEPNGQPGVTALDDDNNPLAGPDDEDGVVFTSLAVAGNPVTVKVTASVPGLLDAWVDFNVDGDWADAGEQIFVSAPVVAGVNGLAFVVPAGTPAGITYSRFRFSTAGGLSYTGLASDGEVEDYRVFILEPITDIKMHWPQLPDLDNTGMDVDMHIAPLGDDWFCTKTGPVKDIHFWGSFAHDILPATGVGSLTFDIYIFSDFPGPPHSMPADVLWNRVFVPGTYTVHQVADNNPEDWYDPATGLWINDDHLQIYQYDFFIDEDYFVQDSGTVYWLVIKDIPPPDDYTFGWKTTEYDLRYRDDAVYWDPAAGWLPMFYPEGHEYYPETLDLAFVITGPECTPSIDAEKKVWDEANEDWVDSTDIDSCTNAEFLITIHNDGTCCDLEDISVTDIMDSSFEYVGADPPPVYIGPHPDGTELRWLFPDPIPPCSSITITLTAHVIGPPCHTDENYVYVEASCVTTGGMVSDEDNAFVHATEPEWPNHKMHYPQLPNPEGWDVVATMGYDVHPGIVVADDFMCSKSLPITDIHFWGSWLRDQEAHIFGFFLSIHDNVIGPPSHPGEELWSAYITDFEVVPEGEGPQGWYDPFEGWWEHPNHSMYFRYDITDIPNPFCQDSGTIYWLNVMADIGPIGYQGFPEPPLWGWKTSLDHWMDDATWSVWTPPVYGWIPLYDPITGMTLDMAFVITGEAVCGDLTGDGVIDLGDVLFLISYLYKGGLAPCPLDAADVNCDGVVDLGDLLYLISYLYKGGYAPCDPDGDGIPDCSPDC